MITLTKPIERTDDAPPTMMADGARTSYSHWRVTAYRHSVVTPLACEPKAAPYQP